MAFQGHELAESLGLGLCAGAKKLSPLAEWLKVEAKFVRFTMSIRQDCKGRLFHAVLDQKRHEKFNIASIRFQLSRRYIHNQLTFRYLGL
jgi:hypothetical protein